jgi:hypothetical protein
LKNFIETKPIIFYMLIFVVIYQYKNMVKTIYVNSDHSKLDHSLWNIYNPSEEPTSQFDGESHDFDVDGCRNND